MSLFVSFHLIIALYVLQFTASDYHRSMFKLFLHDTTPHA